MLEKLIKKLGKSLATGILMASPVFASEIDNINVVKGEEKIYQAISGYDIKFEQINSQYAEWKLLYDGEHFGTLIQDKGNVVFRGAPGDGPDIWGGSHYLRPFFPATTTMYGLESFQALIVVDHGIDLMMSGKIPYGGTNTTGRFDYHLLFSFDKENKKVNGKGTYTIRLDKLISVIGQDLNIMKIATSRLTGVPKTDGTIGDTGDTEKITVQGRNQNFVWDWLKFPAHYPQDPTEYLKIDLEPCHNIVDTVRQGYEAINTAYKPGFKISISNNVQDIKMIFGAQYNLSQKTYFWADNLGVTPLILKYDNHTNYNFNVDFEWYAMPEDKIQDIVTLNASKSSKTFLGVYQANILTGDWNRIGSLKNSNGVFTGSLKIDPNTKGFFRVAEEN